MMMWSVWSTLKRIPKAAWGVLVGVVLVVAVVVLHRAAVGNAFAAGKKAATEGVVFDSVTLARAAERVAKQMAHTDTVWLRVKGARKKVDSAIAAMPPEVATLPEVASLVTAVNTLTVQVDSLTNAHAAERLAWTEKARVDSAAIYALRIIGTAQRDTIMTLQKRPTRLKAIAYALAAGALGVVVGVVK